MTQEKEDLFKEAKSFFQVFEPKGEIISGVKVPGSVQIIGEVFEQNKGSIIAGNLNKSAYLMAQKRKEGDRSLNFYSQRYDEKIRLSLNAPERRDESGWAYFMASTFFMLEGVSKKVVGMNIYIDNRIPDFFNANSMEALEAGAANIAMKFSDWNMDGVEIAKICAEGEKKFMSKESHFVKYIPMLVGEKGTVTFFDVAAGTNENVKADFGGLTFMVMSSGLKKKNTEEKRRKVFQEVAGAIDIMRKNGGNIDSLDQLTMEKFDNFRPKLSLEQKKRCAFFISENDRAKAGKAALAKGDIKAFVEIINESQNSIKTRLELVLEENEILVDMIMDTEGVKAARMLNMGTDGSVLVVVEKDKKAAAESKIKKTFINRTGLELTTEIINPENEIEEYSIDVSDFKK